MACHGHLYPVGCGMAVSGIHVRFAEGWQCVPSLGPFLSHAFAAGQHMDAERMRPEEAATCRWIGYGVGKGVTDAVRGVTAFAVPKRLVSALHGELIQPFGGVDVSPTCYEHTSPLGFGGFIRWVVFAGPRGELVLGVDWSLVEAPHVGVATRAERVAAVARTLMKHGVTSDTELALLNCRMCEDEERHARRLHEHLVTVADWSRAANRFAPRGVLCPRCAHPTFTDVLFRFCHSCGESLPMQGDTNGLENR